MAVPAGPTEKRYTGNGVTTIFTIPFLLILPSDLVVFIGGVEVVSGFTITGAGNPTSTITFAVAPANLSDILLTLNVPFERLNDYQENGDFLASTVNRDFDRIWQALKQLYRSSTRALTLGAFDVDGAGWYRAKGNGISGLRDPIDPQDAVTKNWVSLLLDGVTGLINTTTGILYDAGNLFDYLRFGVQRTVDTHAALVALSPARNQRARTLGYYSPGDGGGGEYFYTSSSWQLISNGPLNVRQFGAHGDGTANDTPFINLAMEAAVSARKGVYFPTGVYMVDESAPGSGYCILNRGVSMIGEGALRVQIVPVPTLPNTVDYILIKPTTATILDFVEIKGLFTYPNNPGSKRGKRSVYVDMSAVSNSSCFHMEGCYFGPGNDYSFEWFTSTDNPQGGPANSVFERNAFWEGTKLTNAGDSNTFRNCIFRSSPGTGHIGVSSKSIFAGGGQSSQLTIEQSNFDCDGGAVVALNGLKLTMINNNIEQSHGSGTGSSACIDFDGAEGGLAWAVFSGNSVGAFGTAALSTILRISNAAQTEVSHNRFSSALASSAASAILITGSAADTIIEKNEIGTTFPAAIIDLGAGTRGLRKPITLLNGFSTPGGGAEQLNIFSAPADGRLFLNGSLNCPAGGGNGLQIGVLPVGFRYASGIDFGAIAIVSNQYVPCRIAVGTDGSLTLLVVGAATQVFIAASWGGQGFMRGNL